MEPGAGEGGGGEPYKMGWTVLKGVGGGGPYKMGWTVKEHTNIRHKLGKKKKKRQGCVCVCVGGGGAYTMGWTGHKHTDIKHREGKNGAGGRVRWGGGWGGGGGEEVMRE